MTADDRDPSPPDRNAASVPREPASGPPPAETAKEEIPREDTDALRRRLAVMRAYLGIIG